MSDSKRRAGILSTCPHCKSRAVTYTSRKVSDLVTERYMQCTDVECGHSFVVQLGVLRSLTPSGKPDPAICIPLVERRANDIVVARKPSAAALCGMAPNALPHIHMADGSQPLHTTN